jgi:hypothetical protein
MDSAKALYMNQEIKQFISSKFYITAKDFDEIVNYQRKD